MDFSNQLNGNKDPNKAYRESRNKRNQKARESWLEKFLLRDLPNAWAMELYRVLQEQVDDMTDDLNRRKW